MWYGPFFFWVMNCHTGFDLYLCYVGRLQGTIAPLDLFPVGVFLVTGVNVITEEELMERFVFVLDASLFASMNLVFVGCG